MATNDLRQSAERQVSLRIGFYIHAVVYAAVIALLWGINLAKSPDALWAHWPTLGWGIGLGCHALRVWSQRRNGGQTLRERMVEAEIERLGHPEESA